MIVLFHSLTKTILLIFHDIGMKDKRCFRWEAPVKNYFQHLLNLKISGQNDQQLIKHTNERQIVLLKISIVISYNYPIQENSFI